MDVVVIGGGVVGVSCALQLAKRGVKVTVLDNFLFRIARLKGGWSMKGFVKQAIADVRAQVGPAGNVLLALSGALSAAPTLIASGLASLRLGSVAVGHVEAGGLAQMRGRRLREKKRRLDIGTHEVFPVNFQFLKKPLESTGHFHVTLNDHFTGKQNSHRRTAQAHTGKRHRRARQGNIGCGFKTRKDVDAGLTRA